jgi:ribonuclease P protein component
VNSFTSAHRLHHKREFDLVYRTGRRFGDANFQLVVYPNRLPHPRLGLSISAKAVGNAVNRNRIKRLVRESFRTTSGRLPATDVVVNARSGARAATNAELSRSLAQLWDKLASYG